MEGTERPTTGERTAALVALISLAAAIVMVIVAAARNWEALILMVVGVNVVVVGGWYAVSRRGAQRSIAVLVAIAGLIPLVAGIFVADTNAFRGGLTLVFAVLSVGAARHALRRSPRAMKQVVEQTTAAPAAKRPVLIMNPKSGGGKAEKFHLVDECRARGIEPIVLKQGDDLIKLAEDAIAAGTDVIGMAGGDGSQALVATVAIKHDIPHVVVPAGTRNHFALDLGLNRDDVVGALDAFHDGVERRIDLATVNDRVFVNNASLGLYAKIVQSPEYRDAKGKTTLEMLPDLLGPDAEPLDLRFVGPDGTQYPTAQVIQVSNDPYQLHSFSGFGTRERIDLGVLGIMTARIADATEASRFVTLEAAGQVQRFPGWLEWTAPSFRIDSGGPIEIGVDGEAMKMDPPLRFESHPGVLRIRVPRHSLATPSPSTAVHILDRSTLTALARIAGGGAPQESTSDS